MHYVKGIHCDQTCESPQLESFPDDNRTSYHNLYERNNCAEYMVALLEESESIRSEEQSQKTKDSKGIQMEEYTQEESHEHSKTFVFLCSVSTAWRLHILAPVAEKAPKRFGSNLGSRKKKWHETLQNLDKKCKRIEVLVANLRAKFPLIIPSEFHGDMPVASPCEAFLRCMLVVYDHSNISKRTTILLEIFND